VFIISFFTLYSSELSFKLVDGHINATVSIFTGFCAHENLAMLGPCYYLNAGITAAMVAVNNHFNLIDTIVILGKLGSFLFGVFFDSFRYLNVFTTDCKKQYYSP
jgi:hypothetical protein